MTEVVATPKAKTIPSAPCVTFIVNEIDLPNDVKDKMFGTADPRETSRFFESSYDSETHRHKEITFGRDDELDIALNIPGISRTALEICLLYRSGSGYAIDVVNRGKSEVGVYEGMAQKRGVKGSETFTLTDGAIVSLCNGKLLMQAKIDFENIKIDFKETAFTVVLEMDPRNGVKLTRLAQECEG